MRDKRDTAAAGEIALRQTVQLAIGNQARTLEIAITLPHDAAPDDMERAIQQAQLGMSKISDELARQITHLQDEHDTDHAPAIATASYVPALTAPEAVAADDVPALIAAVQAPAPAEEPASAATTATAPPPATTMTKAAFLKAAGELGFKGTAIPKALGLSSFNGIDYAEALEQLRHLSGDQPEAPAAAPAEPPRGFAEEIADYAATAAIAAEEEADEAALAGELAALADLDDSDEPDFGPVAEEEDGVFAPEASSPATPAPISPAMQLRNEAQQRMRELRTIRSEGAPPTTELKQAFVNCVATTLGKDRTQDLIHAIWNPPPGERLNTARTRALVEWSKNDDRFEEVANVLIETAHQPVAAEEA